MPVYYRETIIEPHSQKQYQTVPDAPPSIPKQQQQPQHPAGHGKPASFQQQFSTGTTGTSGGGGFSPRTEESNGAGYKRVESGNWPSNFPKIPPPKGVVDDQELQRIAEEWTFSQTGSGGQKWEAQPGWTRQTQQSYTIETVVEKVPPGPTSAPQQVPSKGAGQPMAQRKPQQPQSHPQQQHHQMQYSSKSYGSHPQSQPQQPPYGQPQQQQQQQQFSRTQPQPAQQSQQYQQPQQKPAPPPSQAQPKFQQSQQPQQQQQPAQVKPQVPQQQQQQSQWSQFTEPGGMDFVQPAQQPKGQPQPQSEKYYHQMSQQPRTQPQPQMVEKQSLEGKYPSGQQQQQTHVCIQSGT